MELSDQKSHNKPNGRWHIIAHIGKLQTPTCGAGEENDGQSRQSDDLESLHDAELTMSCESNTL